ncbi:guanylate kinase [Bdellovibrio sp. HCB337]|uniref:guanylate kinase n=1 Tax=Bdellovibrio sp. HCB337 TaxID=3394358 RepID=UPI0039A4EB05
MKTRMIIVAAPSGAGKSSFVERACREEKRLEDTVTYTTRSMRKGESQGHPYHFVTREEFEVKIKENFFVEWAQVHTNLYGTPYYQLENAWLQGKCIIMDVDVQGAATFKAKYPDAVSIFILPPSIDELRRRIEKRDGGLPADIEVRMANALKETQQASKFDYQIVNDNFEHSYAEFKKIIEELVS